MGHLVLSLIALKLSLYPPTLGSMLRYLFTLSQYLVAQTALQHVTLQTRRRRRQPQENECQMNAMRHQV